MYLHHNPQVRLRQECVAQAIKAGASSPADAVRGALLIEAHIALAGQQPNTLGQFREAVRALTGRRWSADEAATLRTLIDAGLRT